MGLSQHQRDQIADLLLEQIRHKLSEYSPESNNMPFHVRLLGRDRMALFSFIQSINTMLGTSVFEQVAALIAQTHFDRAIHQYKGLNNVISEAAQAVIQRIIDDVRTAKAKPNKTAEIEEIFRVAQVGPFRKIKRPRVDLFLQSNDGTEYYFDLKTAKPNIDEIVGYKRKMLEWIAIRGTVNPLPKRIYTGLAIPYNPYEPQPYDRWTFQGMFDLPNELKVAEEFWDFVGGRGAYEELLQIFENVGTQLRPEIDAKFATWAPKR
jgi:hypothetical protein